MRRVGSVSDVEMVWGVDDSELERAFIGMDVRGEFVNGRENGEMVSGQTSRVDERVFEEGVGESVTQIVPEGGSRNVHGFRDGGEKAVGGDGVRGKWTVPVVATSGEEGARVVKKRGLDHFGEENFGSSS